MADDVGHDRLCVGDCGNESALFAAIIIQILAGFIAGPAVDFCLLHHRPRRFGNGRDEAKDDDRINGFRGIGHRIHMFQLYVCARCGRSADFISWRILHHVDLLFHRLLFFMAEV